MDYNRKFKCKFCDYRGNREELVNHVEHKHSEYITDTYPASRIVYNHLNHIENGKCIICGKPTNWNDKTWKYYRHCGSKSCKDKIKETYRKNALAAKGTYNFAKDPKHLEKMLAGRKISGVYTFSNGTKKTYTGSYERKAIEFMDKVLGVDPDDVMMPGPIIEYEYNGDVHRWITDIYYVPYNLIIEIKDGGDNPNNRSMIEYREKQVAKEKAIISMGSYNYLRLTNNNFEQLLQMFTTLRIAMINDNEETRQSIIQINESVMLEQVCSNKSDLALLFVYDIMHHNIEKIGLTDMSSKYCIIPENSKLVEIDKSELPFDTLTYLIKDSSDINISRIKESYFNKKKINNYYIFESIFNHEFVSPVQLMLEDNLIQIELNDKTFSELTKNALDHISDLYHIEGTYINNLSDEVIDKLDRNNIVLNDSINGYYLESVNIEPVLATKPTTSLYDTINQINTFALLVNKYGGTING